MAWPGRSDPREEHIQPPYQWQAPNPNAALFFGDKWTELHDFLRHRIRAEKEGKKKQETKVVGEHLPAWTEYFLQLMRARGWSMLYPPSSQKMEPMAVVHKDLWQVPEEYSKEYEESLKARAKVEEKAGEAPAAADSKVPLRGVEAHWKGSSPYVSNSHQPLHAVLPFQGPEPGLRTLPYLLFDGTVVQQSEVAAHRDEYAEHFRERIGGCGKQEGKRKIMPGKASDLFCFDDGKGVGKEQHGEQGSWEGAAKGM